MLTIIVLTSSSESSNTSPESVNNFQGRYHAILRKDRQPLYTYDEKTYLDLAQAQLEPKRKRVLHKTTT